MPTESTSAVTTSDKTEETQIVINGVPSDLVAEIDRLAGLDDRSRASWVRRALAEAVANRIAARVVIGTKGIKSTRAAR
jgi:hypothetical protein